MINKTALFSSFALWLFVVGCNCSSGGSRSDCRPACSADSVCVAGECLLRTDATVRDASASETSTSADGGGCLGVVIAQRCCPYARACGDVCCDAVDVCSFQRCVAPGIECAGNEDCPDMQYCSSVDNGLDDMCVSGNGGRCLPRPPQCPLGGSPDPERPACLTSCSFDRPAASNPQVRTSYEWTVGAVGSPTDAARPFDVRNAPIVINMDDDDCDGVVTGRDIPEIIVGVSPNDALRPDGDNPAGNLVVLSVREGSLREKWRINSAMHPWTYLAAGNIDGRPGNEIVACSPNRQRVRAFRVNAAGTGLEQLWESPMLPAGTQCTMPSIADLEGDGNVEVITESAVLSGQLGAIERTYDVAPSGHVIVSDVDNDENHSLEVVSGRRVYRVSGASELITLADNGINGTHPLVAQVDGTGNPEIVSMDFATHSMTIWRVTSDAPGFAIMRERININGSLDPNRCGSGTEGRTHGGGPPTAADVNADGVPDIAVAGGVGYVVFDGSRLANPAITELNQLILWNSETTDCSSAQTGSSVFDFNGDGRAEVLYADEYVFRMYRGDTGAVLFETCNTNGTILEGPIVADVDNDGQSDIVVVGNAIYRSCRSPDMGNRSGVRVFSSMGGNWVRTRRVWNQHAYHITNIEEDGTVPTHELPNWSDPLLNNFRLNRQPGNQFGASDAVLSLEPFCGSPLAIIANVTNLGESVLPRGTLVRLYRGTPTATPMPDSFLAEARTTRSLYPAQSQRLQIVLPPADATAILEQGEAAWGRVAPSVLQCRDDNDTAVLSSFCVIF